tara:strand:+ start:215 stop:325 length:111 start_codon:yes stop_codon:yes gene_type:complete
MQTGWGWRDDAGQSGMAWSSLRSRFGGAGLADWPSI